MFRKITIACLITLPAMQSLSVIAQNKIITLSIGNTHTSDPKTGKCGYGDDKKLAGYLFEKGSLGNDNEILISPCGTKSGYPIWGWYQFKPAGPVKELKWYEIDPLLQEKSLRDKSVNPKIRYCQVTFDHQIEASANIYLYDNCRAIAQEKTVTGWQLRRVVRQGPTDTGYKNIPTDGVTAFRTRTGQTADTPCPLINGVDPCLPIENAPAQK